VRSVKQRDILVAKYGSTNIRLDGFNVQRWLDGEWRSAIDNHKMWSSSNMQREWVVFNSAGALKISKSLCITLSQLPGSRIEQKKSFWGTIITHYIKMPDLITMNSETATEIVKAAVERNDRVHLFSITRFERLNIG